MIPEIETLIASLEDWGVETISVDRGQTLLRQGETGDSFYLVKRGRLRAIYNLGSDGERIVGEIGGAEPFGEMAVLGDGTRAATVVAIRDSELLLVPPDVFDRLLVEHPQEDWRTSECWAHSRNSEFQSTVWAGRTWARSLVVSSPQALVGVRSGTRSRFICWWQIAAKPHPAIHIGR